VVHRLALRPRFAELDPYDHVNHAVYVGWFEEARVRALEDVGLGLDALKATGFQIVVTDLEVRYRLAVGAADAVEVQSRVAEIGRASAVWSQRVVLDGGRVAVEAAVKGGVTDTTGRPARPPEGFFDKLGPLVADGWD
jgi:acyl-CoA thioester hydrolase